MSLHETRHSPAHTIDDRQLLQGLLAQRLYVNEHDCLLLRALLAEPSRPPRRHRATRRGARRLLRAGSAALMFSGALALTLGSPLLPASAAEPQPAMAIVVADRGADNMASHADDALLRALLNSAATPRQTVTTTDKAVPQDDVALAQAELSAGQQLVIPAMQPAADARTTPPIVVEQQNARYYVVRSGDTLSGIAQNFYGNGDLWPTIFNANRDKISDAHWIYPNQQLLIPPVGTTGYIVQNVPVQPQSGRGIGQYTVRAGDTLGSIAAYAYGNGASWWGIYQANRNIISNPDLIYPGQVLAIP